METLTGLKRTDYCGNLRITDAGREVTVTGWVQRQRDLGSLIFIDLRDRTGILQLAFDEKTDREIFNMAFGVRAEYVLAASGIVRSRGEGAINRTMKTGEIEVAVDRLDPPFRGAQRFVVAGSLDAEVDLVLARGVEWKLRAGDLAAVVVDPFDQIDLVVDAFHMMEVCFNGIGLPAVV